MTSSTQGTFFLFSTLEFDVGTHVQLYGAIKVTTQGDLHFFLSNSGELPSDIQPPPGYVVTTAISAPFGMTGVTLENLGVDGHIYKQNGNTAADFSLTASAVFPNLSGFEMDGLIVFEKSSPRLAFVQLSADKAITLTQLIESVIGGTLDWGSDITDQFAFKSGAMYYLKPDTDPPPAGYTFLYTDPFTKQPNKYYPGYHLDTILRMFGRDFEVGLAIDGGEFVLETRVLKPIDFDFITFKNANLEISTSASKGKYIQIGTDVLIFRDTQIADITAQYDFSQKLFRGHVSAEGLGVGFTWQDSGFSITEIDPLPTQLLDLYEEFSKAFNKMPGGCEKIVGDWLKGMCSTNLKPSLNGSPSKADGMMQLPINLAYTITAEGNEIFHADISFPVKIDIPGSLGGLPASLLKTLGASTESIAVAILTNPQAYEALALEVAKRAGGQALARFICRALEQFEQVAKDLAEAAGEVAINTLADAAELAAALVSVALLGLPGIIQGFVDLLKSVWDWLTGEDSKKKQRAEDEIYAEKEKIEKAMKPVHDAIDAAKKKIEIASLDVSIDTQNQYVARWIMSNHPEQLGNTAIITYVLTLIEGPIGYPSHTAWPGTKGHTINSIDDTQFQISMDNIPHRDSYGLNASVIAAAKGVTFLTPTLESNLKYAIGKLGDIGDKAAQDFATYLSGELSGLQTLNSLGITSDPQYAQLSMPAQLTVGQSIIGVNTRISDA
jgi:hypothetical protein